VLERLGENERAESIRSMGKALEGYSDIPDPWVQSLMSFCYDPHQLVSAAGTFASAGNSEEAIRLAELAIKYDPDNATAHFQLGNMYRADDLQKALSEYEMACRLNPQLSDAWLFRALIYKDQGSVEQCDQLLKQGLLNCPDSPALHLAWGEQLVEKGRMDEAIPILKRSIKLRPQEAEAYLALARIYIRQSKLDMAKDITMEAMKAEAGNPTALSFMVILSINQKNESEAEAWLQKVERQPRCTPEMRRNLAGFFEQAFSRKPTL
jgi:tetratricopeptide (TPR) repeat protein